MDTVEFVQRKPNNCSVQEVETTVPGFAWSDKSKEGRRNVQFEAEKKTQGPKLPKENVVSCHVTPFIVPPMSLNPRT